MSDFWERACYWLLTFAVLCGLLLLIAATFVAVGTGSLVCDAAHGGSMLLSLERVHDHFAHGTPLPCEPVPPVPPRPCQCEHCKCKGHCDCGCRCKNGGGCQCPAKPCCPCEPMRE